VANLDLTIEILDAGESRPRLTRRYRAEHTEKTIINLGTDVLEKAVTAAIEDLMRQMIADPVLARHVSRN